MALCPQPALRNVVRGSTVNLLFVFMVRGVAQDRAQHITVTLYEDPQKKVL